MPNEADPAEQVRKLLRSYGRTYAQEAGIRLTDQPSPLYQLLVLATLLSTRISAGVAVAPYVDDRMAEGARRAGLPASHGDLAALLADSGRQARLAAALVRLSLTRNPSLDMATAES